MFDGQNRLVVWNERYRSMYNIDPQRIRAGCAIRDLLEARKAAGTFPHDPGTYEAELRATIDRGNAFTLNVELDDGRTIAIVNTPTAGGGWVATHEDVTERKRAALELEHTRSFLDNIIENVPSPIVVKDIPELRYRLINRAAETLLGVARGTMLGETARTTFAADTAQMIEAEDRKLVATGKIAFLGEHALITPGNGTRIVTATRLPVTDAHGKPQYLISVINDVTEHKRSEQRIAHMTHHDSLTELPNRTAFNSCIDATVDLAAASGENFAVLTVDIDRFKAVNDVFGHNVGDALLREVARRLETASAGAFIARVGGDEFHCHHADRAATGGRRGAGGAAQRRGRCRHRHRWPSAAGRPHHRRRHLSAGRQATPLLWSPTPMPLCTGRNRKRAARSASSRSRWTSSCVRSARCSRICAPRSCAANSSCTTSRWPGSTAPFTGFEALARWHHPRHGLVPAVDLHSARRGNRHDRRAGRMGPAHGLP